MTVGQRWRAVALLTAFADRGVDAVLGGLGAGGTKSVPSDFRLDGVTLRLWALAAGRWSSAGYLLGLDPLGPQTHRPLVTALERAGASPALLPDQHGPALRVSGTRRLARLVELVGVPPAGVPVHDWPAVKAAHRGRTSIGA